jgi:hypothetical protein
MPGNPNIILRSTTYQYGSTTNLPLTYAQLDGNFIYLDDAIRNVTAANATSASFATKAMTADAATSASFATTSSYSVSSTNAANASTASYIGNTVGLLNQNVFLNGNLSVSPYPSNYLAGKLNVSSFDYRYNAVSRVLTLSSIESSGGTPSTQLVFNQEGGANGANGWSIQSTNLFDNSAGTPLRLNQYGGNVIIGASTDAGARLYINSTNADFTNSNGANSHILLNNGTGNGGQTNLSFTFQGGMRAKIRADFAGNLNYVAFGNGNPIYANHYFWVNGDSGVGSVAMNIMGGTGRVGINNASPAAYLDVAGGTILGSSTAQAHTINGNLTLNGNTAHYIYGNVQLYNSPFQINNSYQSIFYSNSDQTNTNASNAHLILSNSNTFAQTVLVAHTQNGVRGKWRVDYLGNTNYVAYTVTGSHTFWTNGDQTDGGTAVIEITGSTVGIGTTTPNQNYALDVATIGNFRSGLTITGSLTTSGSTFTRIGDAIVTGSLTVTGSTFTYGNATLGNFGNIVNNLTLNNSNTDATNTAGNNSVIKLVNDQKNAGQNVISAVNDTNNGYQTKGKIRIDFAGNITYAAYDDYVRSGPTGSHYFYIGGDSTTGSLAASIGNSVIDLKRNTTISGSLNVTGSNTLIGNKIITGSVFITGSKTIIGNNTITGSLFITGSKTIVGNTTVTGSVFITGSSRTIGSTTITGSLLATGSHILTGTVTIANLLTLPTYSGVLPTGANAITGSIAASGSGVNCKLYFYNGTWNALF